MHHAYERGDGTSGREEERREAVQRRRHLKEAIWQRGSKWMKEMCEEKRTELCVGQNETE